MKLLVIDIETTGLASDDKIVEIGGVFLDLKTKEITPAFNYLVKETGFNLEDHGESWIFQNSDLTCEMILKKGQEIEEIRKPLQALFDQYPTIAYNKQFDFGFLRRRGFTLNTHNQITLQDPMHIATDVLKIPGYYGRGYKWPKVQECLDYWKFNEIEPHRASEDAMLEAKIILKLYEIGKYGLQ